MEIWSKIEEEEESNWMINTTREKEKIRLTPNRLENTVCVFLRLS